MTAGGGKGDCMSETNSLEQQVREELNWEPSIYSDAITVGASADVVTLTGTVRSYAEKVAAERAVKRVRGVRGVVNDLDVKLLVTHQKVDTDIAEAAVRALQWNAMVPPDTVRVHVSDGWIRLEGVVDAQYQRGAAEDAVRPLLGVLGVSNLITVRPPARASEIKAKIEAALHRRADLDAAKVDVQARDRTVVLRGKVHSWKDRELVEAAVWAAPGVVAVEDELKIED